MLNFTQNSPNDSSHNISVLPKFWAQTDFDWSKKLDNSGSYERLDFTQNPPYYDVPRVRTKFVLKWRGWCIA
ncbi:unnamed protein product [Prunus armeniaca]